MKIIKKDVFKSLNDGEIKEMISGYLSSCSEQIDQLREEHLLATKFICR